MKDYIKILVSTHKERFNILPSNYIHVNNSKIMNFRGKSVSHFDYADILTLTSVEGLEARIIGLVQYRRLFSRINNKYIDFLVSIIPFLNQRFLISKKFILKSLKNNYDIILSNKAKLGSGLNIKGYIKKHFIFPRTLETLDRVIYTAFPDYTKAYNEFKNSEFWYSDNMLIARKPLIEEYINFLFELLNQFEIELDEQGVKGEYQRIYGYLGELVLNLFVIKNEYRIVSAPIRYNRGLLKSLEFICNNLNNIIKAFYKNLLKTIRFQFKYRLRESTINQAEKLYKFKTINVLGWYETIDLIILNKLSFTRFGDGELSCIDGFMLNKASGGNKCLPQIRKRLISVLNEKQDNLLIGFIPNPKNEEYGPVYLNHVWNKYYYYKFHKTISKFFSSEETYGDATSFLRHSYIPDNQKEFYLDKLNKLWLKRDVVFVYSLEGKLNIHHKIFSGANIIGYVYGPRFDAFECYDIILESCITYSKNILFLVSLGFTSTVLVHDLSKVGYQAIDIGHITNSIGTV